MIRKSILVNGNEAAALAAISGGVRYFSHYPGSPVNFIEPALRSFSSEFNYKITVNDSVNEHIAALTAGGASFCGAKSMMVTKHVGMNISADPLAYLAYTGVRGGMLVVCGTDAGANASTGEQDVHWYARMLNMPLFEPSSVEEIYEMGIKALDISSLYQLPVLLFIPTRLAYSSEQVNFTLRDKGKEDIFEFKHNKSRYINVGQRNVSNHRILLEKLSALSAENDIAVFGNRKAKDAVISTGTSFPKVYETLAESQSLERYTLVKVNRVFPLPGNILIDTLSGKECITVVEDQDGFLESEIKMKLFNELRHTEIRGKNIFPAYGEISINEIREHFSPASREENIPPSGTPEKAEIPECLGTFCEGCPHRSVFYVLDKIIDSLGSGIIGGDIGCSSLPPFRADWLMCMNAGIGISQGISQAGSSQVLFSTGGDGSLFHGGLLSLMNAVKNKTDIIHLVLDNKYIAMTGHQESPGSVKGFKPEKLLYSLGVDRVYRVKATSLKRMERILRSEIHKKGVRIIWIDGKCSRVADKRRDYKIKVLSPNIKHELCGDCTTCYDSLACPAIYMDGNNKPAIDPGACVRCGTCRQICRNRAISAGINLTALLNG